MSGAGAGKATSRRRPAGYVDEAYLRDSAIVGESIKPRIDAWNTLNLSTTEHTSERRLVAEVRRFRINKDAGRELLALLRCAGMASITMDGRALILRCLALARRLLFVDLEDVLDQWSVRDPAARHAFELLWANLERRDAEATFFASVTRIVAVGQRL